MNIFQNQINYIINNDILNFDLLFYYFNKHCNDNNYINFYIAYIDKNNMYFLNHYYINNNYYYLYNRYHFNNKYNFYNFFINIINKKDIKINKCIDNLDLDTCEIIYYNNIVYFCNIINLYTKNNNYLNTFFKYIIEFNYF